MDVNSNREKLATHAVFDEAHYSSASRPPGAQLLYEIGHPDCAKDELLDPKIPTTVPFCDYPPLHSKGPTPISKIEQRAPLPLSDFAPTRPPCARAAKVDFLEDSWTKNDSMSITFSPERMDFVYTQEIPVGKDAHMGLSVEYHRGKHNLQIVSCRKGTSAAKIPRWRSLLRHRYIMRVDDMDINTIEDFEKAIHNLRQRNQRTCTLHLATDETDLPAISSHGTPQLYFDQMNVIHSHLKEIYDDRYHKPAEDAQVNKVDGKFFRRRDLMLQEDWKDWKASEWLQLDQYLRQGMFGPPCRRRLDRGLFNLVWTYLIKTDGTGKKKARCTCDGSPRSGQAHTLDHTYAACVDHNAMRLFYAIAAKKNHIIAGGDASNAFGEAKGPRQEYYIRPDAQFKLWWTEHLKRPPIPEGYVIPVQRNMQGHPEAPRLWSRHCHQLITDLGFKATRHEPCLYRGTFNNKEVFLLRQVDDFAVSADDLLTANAIISMLDESLKEPMKFQGIIDYFNGVTLVQTKDYIKITCKTYLERVFARHGWNSISTKFSRKDTPMSSDTKVMLELETTTGPTDAAEQKRLQQEMGFSYRAAIGELIYALITCRPDVSFPVIKMSQYSTCPARCHYIAVKNIFRYLLATIDDGLTYWRTKQCPHLPDVDHPKPVTPHHEWHSNLDTGFQVSPLFGMVDSDWASDRTHRKSVTGFAFIYAGAAVIYKTRFQTTVAMSSTEAEFVAASDAGKMALYLRSILADLSMPQDDATIIYEDNMGAFKMATAGQPTTRTRHIDIRCFALLDWVEHDLITIERLATTMNTADMLTKSTPRILFHRHNDIMMGKLRPTYLAKIACCEHFGHACSTSDAQTLSNFATDTEVWGDVVGT